MAQRRTTRKTNSKTTKRKTTRRTAKKPKVYIPAYKAIILCCAIITICMGLLLVTTIKKPESPAAASIAERYTEKEETKKAEEKKPAPAPKQETKPETKPAPTPAPEKPAEKKITPPAEKPAPEPKPAPAPAPAPEPKKSKYNFPKAKNNAQLIFVFDDGGQKLEWLSPFLKLPFPITVAVLPQLKFSAETAAQTRASGNEVILHQPMQAINESVNPGPGAIKPNMSEGEIKSILFQNVTEIGPIAGMNNHEGSAITADAEKMAVVLQFCSQEGIYFLDSRTNVETKVPYVARELGYSYYERNIFLDNEKTNANALKELKKGLDLANKNGSVIMIGHIWSADFLPAFLQDVYPELKEKGYTFSVVSRSKARKN